MRFVLCLYAALLCAAVCAEEAPLGEVVDLEKLHFSVSSNAKSEPQTKERLTGETQYLLYCKPDCVPCLTLKQRLNEMKIKYFEVTPEGSEVDAFPTMFVLIDGKAVRKIVGSRNCLNYFLEK